MQNKENEEIKEICPNKENEEKYVLL